MNHRLMRSMSLVMQKKSELPLRPASFNLNYIIQKIEKSQQNREENLWTVTKLFLEECRLLKEHIDKDYLLRKRIH